MVTQKHRVDIVINKNFNSQNIARVGSDTLFKRQQECDPSGQLKFKK